MGGGGNVCFGGCDGGVEAPAAAPTAAPTSTTSRGSGTRAPRHIDEDGVIPLNFFIWCWPCGVRADDVVAIASRRVCGSEWGRRGPGNDFGCGRSKRGCRGGRFEVRAEAVRVAVNGGCELVAAN